MAGRVGSNILHHQLGPLILCILNGFGEGCLVCIHQNSVDFHDEIKEDLQPRFGCRAAIVHLEDAKSTNLAGPEENGSQVVLELGGPNISGHTGTMAYTVSCT